MTAIKYHVNDAHEVKECKANIFPCKFKTHYQDMKEAVNHAEKQLQEQHELFSKIDKFNKTAKNKRVKGILNNKEFDNLDIETRKMIVAAIKKLDNKSSEHDLWHSIYDSTPPGQIALHRSKNSNKLRRLEKADKAMTVSHSMAFSSDDIELTNMNKEMLNKNFTIQGKNILEQDKHDLEDATKKMTLLSATWMSNLTSNEIDAVNWITGHGAGILNKHIIGEQHPSSHQYTKEFLDEKRDSFVSAMEKAPELDEPVVFYRGTKYKHVMNDSLNNIASSSYGSKVAKQFAKDKSNAVIMEIRTKKIPSVVAMSEWGTSELEIFAPLGKYKKIDEFQAEDGTYIVQLEFLG